MRAPTIGCLLGLLVAGPVVAGPPFPLLPDWVSSDASSVSTGAALVDLDRDGWLDLVVSNGNDISRQSVVVYYNDGNGALPTIPGWSSASQEYHGQLATGDVNQDGWPDVAVAVFLGPGGFGDPGWAALYLNDGAGNLPPTPSWVSADTFYGFGVALGDADSDGDLDLAVAVGEPYFDPPAPNRIYFNLGGALATTPGWTSQESEHNLGVVFADADDDGDLDLAFGGSGAPHRIYYQASGRIATTSGWESSTTAAITVRLAFGDLDRDGHVDLAVAENNQLGGEGRFRVFSGSSLGLPTSSTWESDYTGYGSEAVLGDVNGDGWLDFVGGSWGEGATFGAPVRIYSNRYVGPLDTKPGWVSSTGSVIERVVVGDVNNDGLHETVEQFAGNGSRTAFRLQRAPVREVTRVVADGVELGPEEYCVNLEAGWISLSQPPSGSVRVDYEYSTRLDLAVANWDSDQGNLLFYSTAPPELFATVGSTGTELRLVWTGGTAPFDVLESTDPRFGPGLMVRAEGLLGSVWEDAPGTLDDGTLTFYLVY